MSTVILLNKYGLYTRTDIGYWDFINGSQDLGCWYAQPPDRFAVCAYHTHIASISSADAPCCSKLIIWSLIPFSINNRSSSVGGGFVEITK